MPSIELCFEEAYIVSNQKEAEAMAEKRKKKRQLLGILTADGNGKTISIKLPQSAQISAGAQVEVYLDADGAVILKPQPQRINIWDTEFVQNYDFARDKKLIGTPDDMGKTGKEI